MAAIEAKAMSISSNPDGGYLVPQETEAEIGRLLSKASPMRQIADVRQVSSSIYKKPFATAGAAAGWVGETAARPQTNAPTLAELQFPAMELYAMPAATQSLLDDSAVNLDEWIAREVETVFAEQESRKPSLSAMAPTSRRASWTTPKSRIRPGSGVARATSRPAWPVVLR